MLYLKRQQYIPDGSTYNATLEKSTNIKMVCLANSVKIHVNALPEKSTKIPYGCSNK